MKNYKSFLLALFLFIIVLIFSFFFHKYIDQIYYSVAYTKISNKIFKNIDTNNKYSSVDAAFNFVDSQIGKEMAPPNGLNSFEYLAYGYAFCDSQADVLMNLLYYGNITSRIVPLYFPDGRSNHTIMEWYNGKEWLLLDPVYGHKLNVSATNLVSLPKKEMMDKYNISEKAYDFYAKYYFEQIRYTYSSSNYRYGGPLQEKKMKSSQILDRVSRIALSISDEFLPKLIQGVYLIKKYRQADLENKYLIARNKELLGDKKYALSKYKELLEQNDIPEKWPGFAKYSVNKEMLQQRIQIMEYEQ